MAVAPAACPLGGEKAQDRRHHFTVLRQQTLDLSQAREFLEEKEPFRFEEAPDVPRDPNRRYTLELRDVSFRYPA